MKSWYETLKPFSLVVKELLAQYGRNNSETWQWKSFDHFPEDSCAFWSVSNLNFYHCKENSAYVYWYPFLKKRKVKFYWLFPFWGNKRHLKGLRIICLVQHTYRLHFLCTRIQSQASSRLFLWAQNQEGWEGRRLCPSQYWLWLQRDSLLRESQKHWPGCHILGALVSV